MSRHPLLKATLTATTVATAVYLARRTSLSWGAAPDELTMPLPGDDVISEPDLVATRAISIRATPEEVWPWLAQIGHKRGGFYSYDALENLVGLGIHSADEILEEFQDIAVGDTIHLAEPVALTVSTATPGKALVIVGIPEEDGQSISEAAGAPPMPYTFSWAFVLLPRVDGCRLVIRERYGYSAGWAPLMVEPVEWVSFLMTQRMLRGIRDRAQAHAAK
jgi:hypothetical protein